MIRAIFANREDAGVQLAERFKGVELRRPIVLAIPRGGIEVGAPIAAALEADLDIVLSRKLRAPDQPELALGAVSETGDAFLNDYGQRLANRFGDYLEQEASHQIREIERRKGLFRAVSPKASLRDRTVIVTDDGIATGSTMVAALHTAREENPAELIVAVPVAPVGRLDEIQSLCDRVVCLLVPEDFRAVGQFYNDFGEVSDARVLELLRKPMPVHR